MTRATNGGVNEPWTVARVLGFATDDFRKRNNPSPRLDAELLLVNALGVDRVRLVIESERCLNDAELGLYRRLIQRRRTGEPIAYILGRREFYGMSFAVDRRALVPRPDTEILVEVALERTRPRSMYGRALDLCTGTGCVAVAFARARPTWRVTASDVSRDALGLAWENARRHGVAFSLRVAEGDLFAPFGGERFELVTANPPYIPSAELAELAPDIREFEPRLALDGGADGLDVVRAIVAGAVRHLEPGGVLALEVGHDQAARVVALLESAGYGDVRVQRDYGGHERVVSAAAPAG
ncbi:MAG TPA: peptide chain release factor N(5)-glutamine methyltransferase [Polyangiaceae bacterium]